jgi:hypothetical protein
MSTCPVSFESLSPVILAYLETPFAADAAPPLPPELFCTPYSRRLAALGLEEKAFRADSETSYFKWYRDADRATWRQHAANAMLRTMPYYASQIAKDHYHKNLALRDFIEHTFCRVSFTLPTWDVPQSQSLIRTLRTLIDKLLPKSADKIGAISERPGIKILTTRPMTLDLAKRIQSSLPAGVKFQYSNRAKDMFSIELLAVMAPDLPTSDTHRADLEAILDSMHQVKLHKFSKAERSKFVYESPAYTNLQDGEEPPSDGKRRKPVPKNPVTGKPAIWMSGVVGEKVKASEIPEHEWVLLDSE